MTFAEFIAENFEDLQLMSANILEIEGHRLEPGNERDSACCLDWDVETHCIRESVSLMYQTESLVLRLMSETPPPVVNREFEPIWNMVFNHISTICYG
jgi:hypothetical protein